MRRELERDQGEKGGERKRDPAPGPQGDCSSSERRGSSPCSERVLWGGRNPGYELPRGVGSTRAVEVAPLSEAAGTPAPWSQCTRVLVQAAAVRSKPQLASPRGHLAGWKDLTLLCPPHHHQCSHPSMSHVWINAQPWCLVGSHLPPRKPPLHPKWWDVMTSVTLYPCVAAQIERPELLVLKVGSLTG